MNKTGLKAFICSFSVSLLAILVVNKVYFGASHHKNTEIKLPQKNIVLFLKSGATNSSKYAVPTKKIALNTLPDVLSLAEDKVEEIGVILADSVENADIPLEISQALPEIFVDASRETKTQQVANVYPEASVEIKVEENVMAAKSESIADKVSIPLDVPSQASSIVPRVIENRQKSKVRVASLLLDEGLLSHAVADPLLPIEKDSGSGFVENATVSIGNIENIKQVAFADKNIPISGVVQNARYFSGDEKEPSPKKWRNMGEESDASPWITAKARGVRKNKLLNISEDKKEVLQMSAAVSPVVEKGDGVKLAAETIQNLIIPIPEKIMNQENLVPKLSFDGKSPNGDVEDIDVPEISVKEAEKTKNKLLTSITSIFGGEKKKSSDADGRGLNGAKKAVGKIKDKLSVSDGEGRIMPTEMRLSFQPGRAEISGQTLRWIRAFAARAAVDDAISIEVRIDGTSATSLQQKRLNLLYNILASKGVPQAKVNTVFTEREPNSFVIRLMPVLGGKKGVEFDKAAQSYYKYW